MNTAKKIYEIFTELRISGDIMPLEDDVDYWQRKLIEVYKKAKRLK